MLTGVFVGGRSDQRFEVERCGGGCGGEFEGVDVFGVAIGVGFADADAEEGVGNADAAAGVFGKDLGPGFRRGSGGTGDGPGGAGVEPKGVAAVDGVPFLPVVLGDGGIGGRNVDETALPGVGAVEVDVEVEVAGAVCGAAVTGRGVIGPEAQGGDVGQFGACELVGGEGGTLIQDGLNFDAALAEGGGRDRIRRIRGSYLRCRRHRCRRTNPPDCLGIRTLLWGWARRRGPRRRSRALRLQRLIGFSLFILVGLNLGQLVGPTRVCEELFGFRRGGGARIRRGCHGYIEDGRVSGFEA